MSVVFAQALRAVRQREYPEPCERDLLAALEAGRLALDATYDLARASQLPREQLLRRAAAVYLGQCAGNVCDDLADGDCDYFESGVPVASMVQFILQHLMCEEALAAGIDPRTLSRSAATLARAASFGPVELRTRRWSLPVYRELAERTGGDQWQAYLMLLWDGTSLAPQAAPVGARVGLAGYVAMDLKDRDLRFFSLAPREQAEVVALATSACGELEALRYEWLEPLLAGLRAALANFREGRA